MIFICLAPQYKIVISLDVIKITDKYCVSCHPPRRGWASGGSLRSSRQAVACHSFTRSWATMPPEASPPLGLLPAHGLSVNVFQDDTFDVARK